MEKVSKTIDELKKKHDEEMAKYVIQHNDKYKKLMTEKLDFEDKNMSTTKLLSTS